MVPRPPRSPLFPTRRSSDLEAVADEFLAGADEDRAGIADRLGSAGEGGGRRLHGRVGDELLRQDNATRPVAVQAATSDRKSTRLNSSHSQISYAVFCLKKKK